MTEEPDEPTFPLKDYLGFTIVRGERRATATLQLADRHLNPNNTAHGAVAFALMDTAMGAAVMTAIDDGNHCATIEVHTRFHRGASTGTLTAEATVLTAGRSIVHLQARTTDAVGNLIASATGSFAVVQPRAPA